MLLRVGSAAVLSATACLAVGADMPVTYAPPVVVTATRFEEQPRDLPVGVTVVTADDIQRSAARSLPDLLSQLAGIHVRDNTGGPDFQVDLRGFGITADQNTLVLINGQRLSEIELVSPGWSTIPLAAIERIEIMRGSGAVLYGGGATGGTINIVTRTPRPGEKSALLFAGAGSYDTGELRGAATTGSERAGLALSANLLDSDGYRDNNQLHQRSAEASLLVGSAGRKLSIQFAGDEQDLRNPGIRTAAQLAADRRGATTPDDFSGRSGSRMNVAADWRLGGSELAINLSHRDRDAEATQSFLGARTRLTTGVETWALAPRVRIPFAVGGLRNTLVMGGDFDVWNYDSVFLGGFFASHAVATQRNRALYFQDNVALTPGTRLTIGARVQRSENTITELLPAPTAVDQSRSPRAYEIALRQRLGERLSVYGKFGASFRIATVDENRFQVTLLEPQTSRDGEIGAEISGGPLRLRAALFQMQLRNEIYFSPLFPPFGANINLSPTRRQGLELDTQWALSDSAQVFANLALMRAEFRSGSYGGIDVAGKDVPLVPGQTLALGGSWRVAQRTRLNVLARHVGSQRFDNDQANTFGQTMPRYTTLDARLAREAGGWEIAATVRNLTGEKYFSYGIVDAAGTGYSAYPAPERSLFVSARYRLK